MKRQQQQQQQQTIDGTAAASAAATPWSWGRRVAVLAPAVAAAAAAVAVAVAQQQPAALAPATPLPAAATRPVTLAPDTSPTPSVIIPPRATRPTTKPVMISLHFTDAPVDQVLEELSKAAGFIIVKEAPVDGRVTLISPVPVSPDEAVSLLNTVLKGNGYTAIRMGPRTLKVLSRVKASTGEIPVHFGADVNDIADTDDLITQIVPVQSVDAVKLKADLQPLVGSDATLASNAGSNSIIITDTSANIRRIVTIIASLDKKDALESGILVRQLKFADATAAAKLISDIFKSPDQQAQQQQGGRFNPAQFFGRFRGGGGGGGGGPGGGGGGDTADQDKGRTGSILAEADTRTNTIVVTGPKDTLDVIQHEVIDKIAANPAADQTFFIYKVKNGQAADMQNTLNTLFGVNVTSTSSSRTNSSSSLGTNRLGGSSSSSFGAGGSSFGGGGGGGSSFGSSSGSSNRSGTSGSTGGGRPAGLGRAASAAAAAAGPTACRGRRPASSARSRSSPTPTRTSCWSPRPPSTRTRSRRSSSSWTARSRRC